MLDRHGGKGRGIPCTFVIGMNETVFPRAIQEDGFLRDRHRLILSETLGYKIDQKLQGYGEEALLFELLSASARERVYLVSARRCRASPGPIGVSGCDRRGVEGRPRGLDVSLPRRWSERRDLPLFVPPLLTMGERR